MVRYEISLSKVRLLEPSARLCRWRHLYKKLKCRHRLILCSRHGVFKIWIQSVDSSNQLNNKCTSAPCCHLFCANRPMCSPWTSLNIPYIISRAVSDQQGGVTNHYTELSATSSTSNAANCHSRQGRSKMFECVSFEIFQPKGVKCIMLCYAMPSPCEILQSLTTFNLRKLQNYPEQKTKSKPVKQRSASAVRLSFACVAGLEVRRHPPGFHASWNASWTFMN